MPFDEDDDLLSGLDTSPKRPRRPSNPLSKVLDIARADNIPNDIASDFTRLIKFESGASHYDRRGKVKLSPPDPRTGERAVGAVQIKPSTAREVGISNPFDEDENIRAGLRYFAAGGADPVARRIRYFGGPRAQQRYQRTGRIPKGGDVLGTSFQDYVRNTSGGRPQRPLPQDDLVTGLSPESDDDLLTGLQGQTPPKQINRDSKAASQPAIRPQQSVPVRTRPVRPSRPKTLAEMATGGAGVVAAPGVGDLRRIDDPETQRITRIQRQVTSEQTPAEREMRRAPGTQNARLFDPKLTENEEVLRRLTDEQEAIKREQEAAAERQRVMSKFTEGDKAEIADFVNHLKGKGSTYTGIRTGARSVGASALYKLAGLTDLVGPSRVYGGKPEDNPLGEFLRRKALAGELSIDDIPPEQRGQVAEFLTQMGLGLAEIVVTPGGPVTKFAGLAGTESVGRGQSVKEVAKETAKGATVGAVFKAAPMLNKPAQTVRARAANLAREGAGIGAGTYAVERGFGTPVEDAALSAATNVALHGVLGAKRLRRRKPAAVPPERIEDAALRAEAPGRSEVDISDVGRRRSAAGEGDAVLRNTPDVDVPGTVAAEPSPALRRFAHKDFGQVTEAGSQSSVPRGSIRVVDESGVQHTIQRPNGRGEGNVRAIPIKESAPEVPPVVEQAERRRIQREFDRIKESETEAPPSPENVASVPFMITRGMEADLRARGMSQGEIDKLTPQQANDILAKPVSEQPIKEVTDVTQKAEVSGNLGEKKSVRQQAEGTAEAAPNKPITTSAEPSREPSTTSARKAQFAADRAELDLPELPPAERKSWQSTLDKAKPERASLLADEVLNKPRALNDEETASIVVRAQQIKNEHAAKMKEIGDAKDPEVIEAKRNERDALEREFDKLTTAAKKSGTEKGRALASQKLTINQDYDLVSLVQRAKAAKGRELQPEERQKIEQQATRISELEAKLAEAQKAAEARAIEKDIARVRRQIKRGETKQVLDDEFVLLKTEFAQARMAVKGVQPAGLASLDPEGTLTPIILKMARNRVKAGTVKVEEVIDQIHGAIKDHADVSRDEIRTLLSGHNLERDPLPAIKTRLRKQEAELTRRLETRDFTPPPVRKKPVYDREASNLKAQVEGLKRRIDSEIRGHDSKLESALAAWKAGLLTGPKTHARNIGGTASFQVFEEAARLPGSIADLIVSSVTKQRTLAGPSPIAVAKSSYEAATKGIQEAKQIMKYGATAEELKIVERPRELNSGSKILDTYVNTVFRSLGAEDKVFRTYAYKRSLLEQAKLRATRKVSAKELEQNPTPEMVSQALLDAEVATFNNQNAAATGIQWVRERSGPLGKTAIDLTVPFKRTPANIMTRLLESTPLGAVKGAGQLIKAGVNKKFTFEDQRKFSQTIGRSVTGSSLIVLGWKLAEAGLATGLYEEDRGDREVQKAAGRSPMAVRIGDTWHQIGAFSPIGNLLAIGAALHREKNRPPKEGEEPANLATAAIPVVAKSVLEQPMLRGVSGVVDALKEPGRRGEMFVGQLAGSAIPTIVNDVAALTDNKRRQWRGVSEKVQSRIPILRSRLPEEVDVFGRPLESRRTGMVDPTLTSSAKDEPFIKELLRLDVGIVKSNAKPGETRQRHRERVVAQGKAMARELTTLTESPDYVALPDEEKRKAIKDKIEQVRKDVNEAIKTGRPQRPRRPQRTRRVRPERTLR